VVHTAQSGYSLTEPGCGGYDGRVMEHKKKMPRTWALLLCVYAGLHAAVAQAEPLTLATGELPPYASEQSPDQGIALDIVRRAFALSGYEVSYVFKPWMRSLEEAREGTWDGTAHWGRNPERDVGFLISDSILTEQWVFVYRDDAAATQRFDWKKLADLAALRMGAVRFNSYTPEFWALQKSGTLKVDFAKDDLTNLRLLVGGRVDVVPMERNTACFLMKTQFSAGEVAQLRAHPRLLTDQFTTHLMLSKKLPQSEQRMKAFNQGLRIVQKSHLYSERLVQTGCSLNTVRK
jgi:polar amino acid transport system substrate-binding protein